MLQLLPNPLLGADAPLFSIMNYFELYEKTKGAKNTLKLGSRWVVENITWYPSPSHKSILGQVVKVVYVDFKFVGYYYDNLPRYPKPCIRPIHAFLENFKPVI
jgi:hypothetical protein